MSLFHWITGGLLGTAWFSRVVEAGLGMPKVPDIAAPEWAEANKSFPRVSVIVPAKNEEGTIAAVLRGLLSLDYPNYEVLAVNDRSSDATGQRMDEVAASEGAHGRLKILHIQELPERWLGKTHAIGAPENRQRATGCSSPMPTYSSALTPCVAPSPTPSPSGPTISSSSPRWS